MDHFGASDEDFFSFFKQGHPLFANALISLQIFGRLWLRIHKRFLLTAVHAPGEVMDLNEIDL
jgi:hypothetical protein